MITLVNFFIFSFSVDYLVNAIMYGYICGAFALYNLPKFCYVIC